MVKHNAVTGYGLDVAVQREDVVRAQAVRAEVISIAEAAGDAEAAVRLRLDGSEGYPGYSDLVHLAKVLRGSIVLQIHRGQQLLGEGPLRLHIRWFQRADPEGVLHDHFAVVQAWGGLPLAPSSGPTTPVAFENPLLDGAPTPEEGGTKPLFGAETPRALPPGGSEPSFFAEAARMESGPAPSVADAGEVALTLRPASPSVLRRLLHAGCSLVLEAARLHVVEPEETIPEYFRVASHAVRNACAEKGLTPSDYQIRLFVAALRVFDLRESDFNQREFVLMLYIIEGHARLRAHQGSIFTYQKGAFVPFTGILSDATVDRVHRFFVYLEGLFRRIPARTVKRAKAAVQTALLVLLQEASALPEATWLESLRTACVEGVVGRGPLGFVPGRARLRLPGAEDLEEVEDRIIQPDAPPIGANEEEKKLPWTLTVAFLVTRTGSRIEAFFVFNSVYDPPSPQ